MRRTFAAPVAVSIGCFVLAGAITLEGATSSDPDGPLVAAAGRSTAAP